MTTPITFGEFEISPEAYELRRRGEAVHLEPRVFEVLAYLLDHRDRVVPRQELLDALWTEEFVSDSALSRAIRDLRRALGDTGAEQRWIQTVYGRGFRFRGDAATGETPAAATDGPVGRELPEGRTAERAGPAPPRDDARSIAVLPFADVSPGRDQSYFCDGLADELIHALARADGVRVASRSSSFRYRSEAGFDVRTVGHELGVVHLLEGSVRRAGDRLRVTVQLVGVDDGHDRWSRRWDRRLEDVFAIQDEIAQGVVRSLAGLLGRGEEDVVEPSRRTNLVAYEEYLRGRALMSGWDQAERLEKARAHLERALAADAEYPSALAALARVETEVYRNLDPDPAFLERAETLAYRALALSPDLAEAQVAVGRVLGNRYDYDAAATAFRRAVVLAPDDPVGWDELSWALGYQVPPAAEEAEEAAREAIRRAPMMLGPHYHLGRALLHQGRLDAAEQAFAHARELDPNFDAPLFGLSLVHLERGNPEEALVALDANRACARSPSQRVARAMIYAVLGEPDRAFEVLDAIVADGYRDRRFLEATPHLAAVRSDPRFATLLARIDGGESARQPDAGGRVSSA